MDVADVRTWNDAAIDEDGSFMLLASDSGIHVSSDSGGTWSTEVPTAEGFSYVGVSDADGNAVALGDVGYEYGKLLVSIDYGASWSEVTLAGSGAE
jgi:hypothetical protein